MNIVYMWIIVGYLGTSHTNPVPPMADEASCKRVLLAIDAYNTKCIQVQIYVYGEKKS